MIKLKDMILTISFILSQILTISLLSFGCVVLHVYLNATTSKLNFFGYFIAPKTFFADLAILFFYISFFIEFTFTFIYFIFIIIKKGDDNPWLKKELKKFESRVLNHIDAGLHGSRGIGEEEPIKRSEINRIPGIEEGPRMRLLLKELEKGKGVEM